MSIIFGNEFMTLINLYWKLRTVTPCFYFLVSLTLTHQPYFTPKITIKGNACYAGYGGGCMCW